MTIPMTLPMTVPYSTLLTSPFVSNPQVVVPFNPYMIPPYPGEFTYQSYDPHQGQSPLVANPYNSNPNHTQHHYSPNHTSFLPHPKIEFPKFEGTDPKGWVLKAEQYFDFVQLDESKKIKLAVMHFEGRANTWYRYYQTNNNNVTWKTFQADVVLRFENPDNLDVQDRFNKLKQTTTLTEYEDRFEELRTMVIHKNKEFDEEYFLSSFISGLKESIKMAVRMFRPSTLADAVFLSKQEESTVFKSANYYWEEYIS